MYDLSPIILSFTYIPITLSFLLSIDRLSNTFHVISMPLLMKLFFGPQDSEYQCPTMKKEVYYKGKSINCYQPSLAHVVWLDDVPLLVI